MVYIDRTTEYDEPITLADAKNLLGIDFEWKDEEIKMLIRAGREQAENYTRRALVRKQARLVFDYYVYCIEAPNPPLISLDGITAIDSDGKSNDIDVAAFDVYAGGTAHGLIEARRRDIYPPTLRPRQGLSFDITVGFSPAECPAAVKDAIKFFVRNQYDRVPFANWKSSFQALLYPWRIVDL